VLHKEVAQIPDEANELKTLFGELKTLSSKSKTLFGKVKYKSPAISSN